MDKICEELDEAKLEIERLKADYLNKAAQYDSLRKGYNEQSNRLQEARAKIENQSEELTGKTQEISELKRLCEDLKCSLSEKESTVKCLSAANDTLRSDCKEKSQKWEEENRRLLLAVEEANDRCASQEEKLRGFEEQIKGLKRLLDSSQKKCSEAEEKAKAPIKLRERDDVIDSLEQEVRKVEDQHKWKKEQFKHLEEAHNKLREQYKTSKKEWELERSSFLDEISLLQMKLDSQTRMSQDLGNRLQMCNQALAHEESRRKTLEFQVSNFKTRFENVFGECEEAKSQLDRLMSQRDEEVANLRHLLGSNETICKEMKYQARKLQQENEELIGDIKQLQEEKIYNAGNSPSLAKLRNRLKSVERMHEDCAANLKAKEAEWSRELEKLTSELEDCRSELLSKEAALKDVTKELEGCHASLMQLMLMNEEISVTLLVMKSGISEYQLKLANNASDIDMHNKIREDNASLLIKQLEMKNEALAKAHGEIISEHQKVQIELASYKEMLEESSRCQFFLKEQALRMEVDSNVKIKEVCDALDRTSSELTEKIGEANEMEFELQIWKSVADRLKFEIDENHETRKQLEASLLAQSEFENAMKREKDELAHLLEDRDRSIDCLQKKILLLDQEIKMRELEVANSTKMESLMALESERNSFFQMIREKDEIFKELHEEISQLEQESLRREFEGVLFAQLGAERAFENEKRKLVHLMEEKDQRIRDLMHSMKSLEDKFSSSMVSISSQLAEKEAAIDSFCEAWEKITAAEIVAEIEVEEKRMMITELENELTNLQKKLELQEKSLSCSEHRALDIEAALEAKESEMKNLAWEMDVRLTSSDALVNELKSENGDLLKYIRALVSEKEDLLGLIREMEERISKSSSEDNQLMQVLDTILQSFDCDGSSMDSEQDNQNVDPVKEDLKSDKSPFVKTYAAVLNGRSPFRELNS
ncbi:uncharacterized protein At4g38062 [Syzygium oleosum]|uniref:uncharacterized protein At4g38062 n=1 Tax=Syzygium oleosum TaxID=219896 RepID=UPI0024BA49F5|nr:uncharacterized protein At4g38062 [Syzygium oleosum]XP_056161086.1 uncharacterized protein At4g38062 [Syzygium oleosum]